MNKKGVTLIELLVVIVVLGVIAGFTVIKVVEIVSTTRINVDSFNLSTLNTATEDYAQIYAGSGTDVFAGIGEDSNRMQALVTQGYLDSNIRVQQTGATFEWSISEQLWNLEGGDLNGFYDESTISYSFDADTLDAITADDGVVSLDIDDWSTDDGFLTNTTGETRLFVPISSSTYTIDVSAALGAGSAGGYGVFFDTTVDSDDSSSDSGYVLQFDRGYAGGAIIVRPRSDGRESGSVWTLKASDSPLFPTKTEDPDWWTDTHDISIEVTNVDANTREAEFFVDGVSIGSYSYANDVDGEQVYTGFRGWGSSPTEFYSLDTD